MGGLGTWLKDPVNEDILALWIVFLGDVKKKSRVFYNFCILL